MVLGSGLADWAIGRLGKRREREHPRDKEGCLHIRPQRAMKVSHYRPYVEGLESIVVARYYDDDKLVEMLEWLYVAQLQYATFMSSQDSVQPLGHRGPESPFADHHATQCGKVRPCERAKSRKRLHNRDRLVV